MNRNEESVQSRRRFTERLVCTLVFTAVQLWAAVVVVVEAEFSGVLALAVSLVLAAALISVHDAWRELRSTRREPEVEIREDLVRL